MAGGIQQPFDGVPAMHVATGGPFLGYPIGPELQDMPPQLRLCCTPARLLCGSGANPQPVRCGSKCPTDECATHGQCNARHGCRGKTPSNVCTSTGKQQDVQPLTQTTDASPSRLRLPPRFEIAGHQLVFKLHVDTDPWGGVR
jgi:hypothetical protein